MQFLTTMQIYYKQKVLYNFTIKLVTLLVSRCTIQHQYYCTKHATIHQRAIMLCLIYGPTCRRLIGGHYSPGLHPRKTFSMQHYSRYGGRCVLSPAAFLFYSTTSLCHHNNRLNCAPSFNVCSPRKLSFGSPHSPLAHHTSSVLLPLPLSLPPVPRHHPSLHETRSIPCINVFNFPSSRFLRLHHLPGLTIIFLFNSTFSLQSITLHLHHNL